MSDTIQEGVRWDFTADPSAVLDAYKKATDAGVRAGESASKAAQQAGAAFDKLGKQADASGQKWTKAAQAGATASRSLADSLDRASQRASVAAQRVQALQDRFSALRGQAMASFAQGQGMGLQDVAGGILNAGGLRAFMSGAGGPLAVGALAAGVGYGYAKQYSDLQESAEKAHVTAQELSGLQSVMQKLGVDAATTNGMMAEFSRRLTDSGAEGKALSDILQQYGIATRTATGEQRDRLSVLSDLAQAIKGATSDEDKLRLATVAVGQTFAGPFLDAIKQSETGLANLQAASRAAASSLTNDLAKAGSIAMKALKDLGDTADGTYAQIKRALGAASEADRLNAARQDVSDARRRANELGMARGGPVRVDEYGRRVSGVTQDEVDAASLEATRKEFALRDLMGPDAQAEQLRKAYANRNYGPQVPPGWTPPAANGDTTPATGAGAGGGAGSKTPAQKATEDHFAEVSKRLQEQLGLLTTTGAEHDQLALKMKIEAEQAKLGADATQAEKDRVGELVTQIDSATKAQQQLNDAAKAGKEAYGSLSQSLSGALKELINGGKPGDILKKLESSLGGSLLDAGLTGTGPFSKLFGTAGADGATGGLFGLLGGALGIGGGQKANTVNVSGSVVNVGGGLGGLGGGGGLLGGLGNLFGGGDGGIPFAGLFAAGGSIPSGALGIVGERGPELVKGPANVTPWRKLQSMLTGPGSQQPQQHIIHFNVTTPDAPSFARSESQMSALLTRMVARGQRNL